MAFLFLRLLTVVRLSIFVIEWGKWKHNRLNKGIEMSKKQLLQYMIWIDGYKREWTEQDRYRISIGHEVAHKMKTAIRIARRMGIGSEIVRVSQTRSGKKKYKTWVYGGG